MTDSMVERVVRAIEEGLRNADAWPEKDGFVSTEYGATTIDGTFKMDVVACAVIEAMRKPTDAMKAKAIEYCEISKDIGVSNWDEFVIGLHQVMIDAALAETSEPGQMVRGCDE